jgi:hypothetical protein
LKSKILIAFTFFLIFGKTCFSQSLLGTWKGTSICQVKNSPCHDEIVVYHISKDSIGDAYQISANKIIAGKEDYMGTILCSFNQNQNILFSIDSVRNAKWEFKLNGNEMHGTLIINGSLYRIVEIKKEN